MDWSETPTIDSQDWHSKFGGQEWRYDHRGIYLRAQPDTPQRSSGEPTTCRAILSLYGPNIHKASMAHGVPPELIVMTIATETAIYRDVDFTGPRTFRWEPGVKVTDVTPHTDGDYSAGPMQTLATTARDIIGRLHLPYQPFVTAPYFASRPAAAPATNPLYGGAANIDIGTAEIRSRLGSTGSDPILVAAAYNAGSLRAGVGNPWNLHTYGDHLNRAAEWFGDACTVLAELREASVVVGGGSSTGTETGSPTTFELNHLTGEEAADQYDFYTDSGAHVKIIDEDDDLTTLQITYPAGVPPVVAPLPGTGVGAPPASGFALCIDRLRTELRDGMEFRRTVGAYQAYFDGAPIAAVKGYCVERQGPGDNTATGVINHRRVAAGTYPLFTHTSPVVSGRVKYRTLRFADPGDITDRPWPCIGVEGTNARSGILIHCAKGYIMSIGCINLAASVNNASSNLDFADSRSRVIALIDSMKSKLGNRFPKSNNKRIPDAVLIIRNEP